MLTLENQSLKVCLTEGGSLAVLHKRTGRWVEQLTPEYQVSQTTQREDCVLFALTGDGAKAQVSMRLVGPGELEMRVRGQGELTSAFDWPPPWQMQPGDRGVYPMGTGMIVPVDDCSFPLEENMPLYCGMRACMNLFGFNRGKLWVLTGIECGNDAEIQQVTIRGLRHSRLRWLGEKGNWGYERVLRFFLTESLSDGTARYRHWREQLGQVVTLKEKIRHTPAVAKLIGAADVWLWDDNAMNRLYGRREVPEREPRNVRRVADEMEQLGMTRVLWNAFEGESAEDCAYLRKKGFLVGKYDIYRDVLPKNCVDKIIPYRVRRSVNTRYWPEIVRIDANGDYGKAWPVHGLDGRMYDQHAVCDIPALRLTMENVPPEVEKIGYTSRLIDVQAGTALQECYHPRHPATRSDSLRYINNQLRFLGDMGLVCGVEVGGEATAGCYHYSEGMLSPVECRAPDAGRRMTTRYEGDSIPPQFRKYMLNPHYRIPLWDLVYHDCTVNYWYWGDSSNCCPELMPLRDLFDALYGMPPLYSLTATQWQSMKQDIAASYHRATKTAALTGLARMMKFQYLSKDSLVQKTVFDNGIAVTANFSNRVYVTEQGRRLEPLSYAVSDEGEKR